jgi:hypothetical protein
MTSRVGVPWVETDISDVVSVQQPAQEPFQAQSVSYIPDFVHKGGKVTYEFLKLSSQVGLN